MSLVSTSRDRYSYMIAVQDQCTQRTLLFVIECPSGQELLCIAEDDDDTDFSYAFENDDTNANAMDAFCNRGAATEVNAGAEFTVTTTDTMFMLQQLTFEFLGAAVVTVDLITDTALFIRYRVWRAATSNLSKHRKQVIAETFCVNSLQFFQFAIAEEDRDDFTTIDVVTGSEPDVTSFTLSGFKILVEPANQGSTYQLRNVCGKVCKGLRAIYI